MSTKRPRYRYIAFHVETSRPPTREEVMTALRIPGNPLWLVSWRSPRGLVRATNVTKDSAIQELAGIRTIAGMAVQITTLGTSGTIRRALAKYIDSRTH